MDREELKRLTKEEISRRIREGVKAVIEQVLEEEMTEHLAAGYEGTPRVVSRCMCKRLCTGGIPLLKHLL
jgi:transposase-like protein